MKLNSRLLASIIEIILGASLMSCALWGPLDEFWSGMGTALLVVGVLQLLRQIKYKRNKAYQEAVDTERKDERNKFISMKAWSWAGYIFVLISAVSTILLKVLGYEDYMIFASSSVCLIVLLYWASYLVLRRKY